MVIVILGILASLSLGGLAITRQRARIDKTRSTIRKLHEIIVPQYESYLARRVTATGTTRQALAQSRLEQIRTLQAWEMPDQWADVAIDPVLAPTAPARRYAIFKAALGSRRTDAYGSAECLALIVMRGGFAEDALDSFRADEIGDIDGDGAPEFHDGWGRPIAFIRWPAGLISPLQPQDRALNPDPFDPMGVSGDWGVTPLIYSPGPDEAANAPNDASSSGYGLVSSAGAVTGGWLQTTPIVTTRAGSPMAGAPLVSNPYAARDNITNLDLWTK